MASRGKIEDRNIQEVENKVSNADPSSSRFHPQKHCSGINVHPGNYQKEYSCPPSGQYRQEQGGGRMQEKAKWDKQAASQQIPGDDRDAQGTATGIRGRDWQTWRRRQICRRSETWRRGRCGVRHGDGVRSRALSCVWERRRLKQELRLYRSTIEKHHPPDADADLNQRKHRHRHPYKENGFRIQAIARRRFKEKDHRR